MAKPPLPSKAIALGVALALVVVANPELRALLFLINAVGADVVLLLLGLQLRVVASEALAPGLLLAAVMAVAGWRLTLSFVLVRSPYALSVAHHRLARRCSR